MKLGIKKALTALIITLITGNAAAEVSVIVNKSNKATISNKVIAKIFLGKQSVFPGGGKAVPVNLEEGNPNRAEFDKKMLRKNPRQMKAYWAKLVFTGKASPPKEVDSDSDMIKLVSNDPSIIGFVDSASVTDEVVVIHKF